MVTLSPTQVAELKAKIAAKYQVDQLDDGFWLVVDKDLAAVTDNEHFEAMDAEAEMEAIIQDEVRASMEEIE